VTSSDGPSPSDGRISTLLRPRLGDVIGREGAPRDREEQHRLTERGERLEAERGGRLDEEHAAEPLDPLAAAHGDLDQAPEVRQLVSAELEERQEAPGFVRGGHDPAGRRRAGGEAQGEAGATD
jgi:hypothetical protein